MVERKPFSLEHKSIEEVAKKFSDRLGLEVKVAPKIVHERILLGIHPLDWLIEGVPLRALFTVFGPDSSGKTTFAAYVAKKFQEIGGIVFWIDNEFSFDPNYFSVIGVDVQNLLYLTGITVEEVFNVMVVAAEESQKDNFPYLVVWDSVAATPSKEEADASFDERKVASSARATSYGLKKLAIELSKFPKVSYLAISQVREDIGNPYSPTGYSAYGGWALKHYQMLSLEFRKVGRIEEDEMTGVKSRVIITKSKLSGAQVFRYVDLYFKHGGGIDEGRTLLDIAKNTGYVKVSGGWYKLPNNPKSYRVGEIIEELFKEPHIENLKKLWYAKYRGQTLQDVQAGTEGVNENNN